MIDANINIIFDAAGLVWNVGPSMQRRIVENSMPSRETAIVAPIITSKLSSIFCIIVA